jgi:hypothetical protein
LAQLQFWASETCSLNNLDVQSSWLTSQHLAAMKDVFLKDFYEAAHNAKGAVFQQAVNQLIEAGADQRRIEYLVMPNRSERIQYGWLYFELHTVFENYFIRYEMRPGLADDSAEGRIE